MPPLYLTEVAGRCRLSMSGFAVGSGHTLQEAADDLVHRVMALVHTGALVAGSTNLSHGPDPRLLALMNDVSRIAAEGGDVRERLFGASS
jgi:hypothetical protein